MENKNIELKDGLRTVLNYSKDVAFIDCGSIVVFVTANLNVKNTDIIEQLNKAAEEYSAEDATVIKSWINHSVARYDKIMGTTYGTGKDVAPIEGGLDPLSNMNTTIGESTKTKSVDFIVSNNAILSKVAVAFNEKLKDIGNKSMIEASTIFYDLSKMFYDEVKSATYSTAYNAVKEFLSLEEMKGLVRELAGSEYPGVADNALPTAILNKNKPSDVAKFILDRMKAELDAVTATTK